MVLQRIIDCIDLSLQNVLNALRLLRLARAAVSEGIVSREESLGLLVRIPAVADGVVRPIEVSSKAIDLSIGDCESILEAKSVINGRNSLTGRQSQVDGVPDEAVLRIFKTCQYKI